MDAVYAACQPVVERTLGALDEVMRDPRREQDAVAWNELAGLYVVGGASSFPLLDRHLREKFGQGRVRRSPHPFAATAIGLATFLDEEAGYELSDALTRHFGVWREGDMGREVAFDAIFAKDTRLPRMDEPPLYAVRRYRPAHNLGHYRFVECGKLREAGRTATSPRGTRSASPSTPRCATGATFSVDVQRMDGPGPEIEERYRCTSAGTFEVTLAVLDDGFERTYRIARPAASNWHLRGLVPLSRARPRAGRRLPLLRAPRGGRPRGRGVRPQPARRQRRGGRGGRRRAAAAARGAPPEGPVVRARLRRRARGDRAPGRGRIPHPVAPG